MKIKIVILIVFLITTLNVKSQYCPSGYEVRNVKCGKEFITTCVPINYSCKNCWIVSTPSCPGVNLPGMGLYSSYEKAFETAEKNKNSALNAANYKCYGNDEREYIIYIDDSKFCSTNSTNGSNVDGSNNNNSDGNSINKSTNKSANNNQTSTNNKAFPTAPRDLQLQADFQFFYVQHHNAEEKLEEIKKKYPNNAALYENNYRPKLLQLLNSVKSEDAKNNPSPQNVKAFGKQLDNLLEQMETAETMALNSSNAQKANKQQYQTQADDYLNKAQDKTQSSISNQLNLDLAKTNAMMAGNKDQVQTITTIQNQKKEENNAKIVESTVLLAESVSKLFAKKEYPNVPSISGESYSRYIPTDDELILLKVDEAINSLRKLFRENPNREYDGNRLIENKVDSIFIKDANLIIKYSEITYKKNGKIYLARYRHCIFDLNNSDVSILNKTYTFKNGSYDNFTAGEFCLTSTSAKFYRSFYAYNIEDMQKVRTPTLEEDPLHSFNFEVLLPENNKELFKKCANLFVELIYSFRINTE